MVFVHSLLQFAIHRNSALIKSDMLILDIIIQHYLCSLSIHSYSSLFSWPVRYSNRKINEHRTNIFIQHYLWSLSIHCTVRYL